MATDTKDGVRRAAETLADVVYVPGGVVNRETADRFETRIAEHTHAREMAEALKRIENAVTSGGYRCMSIDDNCGCVLCIARRAIRRFHGTEGER